MCSVSHLTRSLSISHRVGPAPRTSMPSALRSSRSSSTRWCNGASGWSPTAVAPRRPRSRDLTVTAWDFLEAQPEVSWDEIYGREEQWSRDSDPFHGMFR